MNSNTVILSTAYLPPIQYIAKIVGNDNVLIEVNETYSKQSYRNRCVIASCNGLLSLSIPVIKTNGNNTLTKEVKIDNSTNWQKNHWKAIESAYRKSAYYEFIADLLIPFFIKKEQFLIDFNDKLINEVLIFIGTSRLLKRSDEFIKHYPENIEDFRNSIHPKLQYQDLDKKFLPLPYFQVFSDRFPFYPNLSIVDLLFNEGLNSLRIIDDSIIK